MTTPYDDFFVSMGEDGASTPVGVAKFRDEAEIDEIMDAWYQERQDNIECGMFLERARRLLSVILSEAELNPKTKRRVRNLILALRERGGEIQRF